MLHTSIYESVLVKIDRYWPYE